MPPHVILGGVALALILFYRYFFRILFLDPLRRIPNAHPTSAISGLWLGRLRRKRQSIHAIYTAHNVHGPIVRLSPKEISVNSLDGLRTIYQGGFERDPAMYSAFENFGQQNLISFTSGKPHAQQKRMVANVYSKSFLHGSQDLRTLARSVIMGKFLPMMIGFADESSEVEALELSQSVAMDMISGYMVGSSNGMNFLGDVAYRRKWFENYDREKVQTPQQRIDGHTESSCLEMCVAADRFIRTNKLDKEGASGGTWPVVYDQLSSRLLPNKDYDKTRRMRQVASEVLDHLIAGHESTGITLTYAMYEMSLRPKLQARLREELSTLPQALHVQPCKLPQLSIVDSLPLLSAILQETLRLHHAVPAPQPRVAALGAKIEGHDIPAGTIVSCNAYSLHRNEEVFPKPVDWIPERWFEVDEIQRRDMGRWFWAFGSGGRMCLGSNFATQNLKMIIAVIYANFETEVIDATGIEQEDAYVAGPVKRQLKLRFKKI